MNAQREWKSTYKQMRKHQPQTYRQHQEWLKMLRRYTREAALERRCEAMQLTIQAQAQRIAELEAGIDNAAEHSDVDPGYEREAMYYLRGIRR